ncbi:hypothetical protein ACH40D_08185 [Streptomyces olivaceoviridis]|uniref:Secreted protein n=1 Tax=Streptomyces olivaceoviridis TaxID=1921 RepID=A0ABW7VB23_STROI|nr:hypothetical protein [Streptomyces corchorusii]
MRKRTLIHAGLQTVVPWLAVAAVVIAMAWQQGLFSWGASAVTGPARTIALPGGGFSDGGRCGAEGYHYFPLPASASAPPAAESPAPVPGPRLVLGSYGYEKPSRAPGRFTIGLLFAPGPKGSLELSRTLGGEGVAVEIEGPRGLVGGAHGLPVTWDSATKSGTRDSAQVSLPLEALCPGQDARDVMQRLQAPIDSSNTITGQPAYTLTVSVRDPAIGAQRRSLGLPLGGSLLSANNLVPEDGFMLAGTAY